MDLNELPLVDEDREERCESAVEIMRREREERRNKMMAAAAARQDFPRKSPNRNQTSNMGQSFPSRPIERPRSLGPLPEGWLDCPNFGQPVACLIPSKVPLGETFNEYIEAGKRYSWRQFLHKQRAIGREVALVIDLTNTTRYYPSAEWTKQGIKHVKIPCKGRDEVPDNESVNNFVHEVMHFLQRGAGKKYILVHCTHGFNRTGFMIVHYLRRFQGVNVDQAIQMFASARPPGIYKQDYIDSLFAFYHEKRPDSIQYPLTPEWKRSGVDLNGEAHGDGDDDSDNDGGIMAALKEVGVEREPMTNDDVLGDAIPDMQQLELQRICYQELGLPLHNHGPLTFPGSQPVSFDSRNLQLLRQRYYYATWKADGTRYMLFITRDGCYLIDRKFKFRRIQLRFPTRNLAELHHHTLLDGEMIIDTIPETGQQERRYLVYDLMIVNQESLLKLPFHERWKRIERDVVAPRNLEAKQIEWYSYETEPIRVRRKGFWMLSATQKLLNDFIPKLPHEADGLIFQGWDDPYITRTHEGLLKWKFPHMNSVDFRFVVSQDGNKQQLFLIEKGGRQRQIEGTVVFPEGEEPPESFSGKIIECSWLPEEQKWNFMRVRVDKETPNAWRTYMKVKQSIEDNITQEDLSTEIEEILRLPMYQERILHEQQQSRRPSSQVVKTRS